MWRFSDGTEADPGGEIRGVSVFAQRLRAELARGVSIQIWGQPSSAVPLDVNDTGHVNQWLNQALDYETRVRGNSLRITKRHPEITPLPEAPWDEGDLSEDATY